MSKLSNLIKLAKKGSADRLAGLLDEEKGNINEIDGKSGRGLIHIAIENDDEEVFGVIVGRPGVNLQLPTADGQTPLEIAVRLNNPILVGRLLDMNVNFRRKNSLGETVLHTALRNQTHRDIMKRLTTNKFDINEPVQKFGSFLNLAIVAGHADNFYFLLKELGVDYTKRFDKQGNSSLLLAVKCNKGDFVVAILEKLQQDPLLTAIDRQFFINHQNNQGNSAIHEAAIKSLQTITHKLESVGKELGLDLTIRNKKGQTVDQIKASNEKDRVNEIQSEKRRQEERLVRNREKNQEKARQREEQQQRRVQELRRKKEEEMKLSVETKVSAETQKKKTLWILAIALVVILGGMYVMLSNAIEKKKPVTL